MRTWRTWSGRWAAVLAGAALAVAPAVARACDDDDDGDDRAAAVKVPDEGQWQDEGARQAFVKSLDKPGVSDEDRARALVRFMMDAPISEQTGAAILDTASRMHSDRALAKVLIFFTQTQEAGLVRGPLAGKYLDAAAHLQSPETLVRALVVQLHPDPIPEAAVSRALELSQRITSDEGIARVLREVSDHQTLSADIEAKARSVAERIHDADLKARVLQRLERAKAGDRDHGDRADRDFGVFHQKMRLPRFAFRFGDEGRAAMPVPPLPPTPPAPPAAPPAPPMAPVPPTPPALPAPRDGEVSINGHVHALRPEEREALRESARRIREQAQQMREQVKGKCSPAPVVTARIATG